MKTFIALLLLMLISGYVGGRLQTHAAAHPILTCRTVMVALDKRLDLNARPINTRGDTLGRGRLTITSEHPAIASVDTAGMVTPHAVGETAVIVRGDDQVLCVRVVVTHAYMPSPHAVRS